MGGMMQQQDAQCRRDDDVMRCRNYVIFNDINLLNLVPLSWRFAVMVLFPGQSSQQHLP